MANCQITPISDQSPVPKEDVTTIPEGRVGQVCKEWLIREDGNLAYRLQNEEITQYYNENRSKNQIVRKDIPLAKHLQQSEILEAQRKYERTLQEQMEYDEKIARRIERRLCLEEEAAKKATEEADEKLAKKLMEKEKAKQMRKRLEKEKQQVERLSAQIGADYRLEQNEHERNETLDKHKTLDRYARSSNHRIMTEDEQELDLSEFCMPPPPGLTPEELKLFLEEQDAEIARLLQHQELKRSRNPEKEKLALIEQQDFEIAKMLQKMEKKRFKRIKEKLRNQRLNQSTDSKFHVELQQENRNYQRTSTPLTSLETMLDQNKRENDYDIPENHLITQQNDNDETYEEPYNILSQYSESKFTQNFHNIAIDLDPTYKRRSQLLQSSSQGNLIESCVDDEERQNVNQMESPRIVYRDSFEKLPSSPKSHFVYHPPSYTSSSRSSNTSSGSRNSNNQKSCLSNSNQDDYAPPLPPRDVSLMPSYNKTDHHKIKDFLKSNTANLLPPHHPQHPNRQYNDSLLATYSSSTSQSAPIQGQRRIASMEKQQKKFKQKNEKDGCKTQ